ncbi:DUF2934 domain-containing protein [uncultured Thiohalocapsa sp.]|uniref:DUF2934 domain-containing protein n=1 Tax=uncultured Thiohalocapsa sp. TaxID=768990 RepID=UPI0025D03FC1|nr:DUF2934 domain-containing protein [uncultured Thiohalocapsa sp.]
MAKSKGTPEQKPQAEATPQTTTEAAEASAGESPPASGDSRQDAIERLAYQKAEQRGFAPGHEMDDWLDAEREVASAEGGR